MTLLFLLLAPLWAADLADDTETLKQQILASQPFMVKAPRWWKSNPESMKRLLLKGERSDAPAAPMIMVELLDEKSEDYLHEMTAPKRRADVQIPIHSFTTRRGKARSFKRISTERFPRGAPDAVTVQSVQEHVVVDIEGQAVLFVLTVPEQDYKSARRDFMRIIDSLRIRPKRDFGEVEAQPGQVEPQ